MKKLLIVLALMSGVALPARIACADTIHLKNGNKIEGQIIKETAEIRKTGKMFEYNNCATNSNGKISG